jgi:hypothetical protein
VVWGRLWRERQNLVGWVRRSWSRVVDLLKALVLALARCSLLKASRADWMSALVELGFRSRALRADLSSLACLEILWRNVLL